MSYPRINNEICHFRVWAPQKESMRLHVEKAGVPADGPNAAIAAMTSPPAMPIESVSGSMVIPMVKDDHGYFNAQVAGLAAGDRYRYQPDSGGLFADPRSAFQPEGVHGPSEIVDHGAFKWTDTQYNTPLFSSLIFYELHVGTFTSEGTFEAIIPRLSELAGLGINAIELMPVAQSPGRRNWGYDGVYLYAAAYNYGGPEGLKRLVDACHAQGIAVFLDVVYNHIGAEGNTLEQFGPYFSETYKTPWGKALNFDSAWSDGVRAFIVDNALFWAEHYHIDGLRLDAIHEIFDRNAISIWEQLRAAVDQWSTTNNRPFYLVAESDLNNPRVVQSPQQGGMGCDAQWLDDFHHSIYVKLDPDGIRHYQDYGRMEQIAKAYTEGFVHSGDFVTFRHRTHGASSAGIKGNHFIVFNQNHDIPGNRPDGRRLCQLTGQEQLKLAAAALFLSPYIPMLFMGEEYGADTPFYFFSDYSAPGSEKELIETRKKQFEAFHFDGDPVNPQEESVFIASKLRWQQRNEAPHAALLEWHRQLIRLRRSHPLLRDLSKTHFRTDLLAPATLCLFRQSVDKQERLVCLLNFSDRPVSITLPYDAHTAIPVSASLLPKNSEAAPTAIAQWTLLLSTHPLPASITTTMPLTLPGWAAAVYATPPVDTTSCPAR